MWEHPDHSGWSHLWAGDPGLCLHVASLTFSDGQCRGSVRKINTFFRKLLLVMLFYHVTEILTKIGVVASGHFALCMDQSVNLLLN